MSRGGRGGRLLAGAAACWSPRRVRAAALRGAAARRRRRSSGGASRSREVLARPDLDPTLRERLELVLAARDFAAIGLGLRVGDSYTSYAEVAAHEATVHVVLGGARRDRLEAHTWWYPIVGRVPYKGFFDRGAGAGGSGIASSRRGLDTDVRPRVAFSTLGWFADPLLVDHRGGGAGPAGRRPCSTSCSTRRSTCRARRAFNESAAHLRRRSRRGGVLLRRSGRRSGALRRRAPAVGRDARAGPGARAPGGAAPRALRRASHAGRARARGGLGWPRRRRAPSAPRALGGASDVEPPNNARLLGALLYDRPRPARGARPHRCGPDRTPSRCWWRRRRGTLRSLRGDCGPRGEPEKLQTR